MYALDLLLDRLPDALVDEAARKNLRLIGDQLPDVLSTRLGVAVRLHDNPAVDLLLHAATQRQLGALAGADRLPDGATAHPGWRGTMRLAERSLHLMRYADPLPPPIWLEFTAGADRPDLPSPAVFAAVAPEPGDRRAAGWDVAGSVAEVLATVAPGGPVRGLVAQLDRVLVSGLAIRQIGCAPGRPADLVRVFGAFDTAGDEATRLLAALERCGWSGRPDAVAYWTAVCAEWADLVHVSLDVTPGGIRPRIGIEASQVGTPQPHEDARWGGLLDVLRAAGVCTGAKRDAVCCLGEEYETDLFGRHRFRQGLHHVKVTVSGDGGAVAKAYVGAYELGSG